MTGSLALKVTDNISPLENLDIILTLSYKNRAGEAKMTTTHKPMPPFMAGVPGFSLTLDEPTNHIAVGGRAQFTFKITLRKMKSPLKLQVSVHEAEWETFNPFTPKFKTYILPTVLREMNKWCCENCQYNHLSSE